MKKLYIWITLWVRDVPTIWDCVMSLRDKWYKKDIYVFSEPWAEVPKNLWLVDIQNKSNLWCMQNYHNALSWMSDRFDDGHIWILQDDMVMCENFNLIDTFFANKTSNAVLNTFHNSRKEYEHHTYYKQWFNVCTDWWNLRGASFIMDSALVRQMITTPFYLNHLYRYEKNKQVDAVVGKTLELLWVSIWTHNPSIMKHIWDESTLGHNDLLVNIQASSLTAPLSAGIHYSGDKDKFLKCIETITFQFDELYISWTNIPEIWIPYKKVKNAFLPWYWEHKWHYFLLSENILYPEDYSRKMLLEMRKQKYISLITVSWANMSELPLVKIDCTHYNKNGWRCNCLYDETFSIPYRINIQANSRRDLARYTQENKIPIWMIKRKWDWVKTQYTSISYPELPKLNWRNLYWLK